jgi:hypothetical protein
MNFRASARFTPRDLVRVQASFVPRIVAAVTAGCGAVVEEAKVIAEPHVRSGDYIDSIHVGSVALVGTVVTGEVVADSEHAAFVEFGTGIRGAASAMAGAGPYSDTWPGMEAQAPLRSGLDVARPAIRAAFEKEGFTT